MEEATGGLFGGLGAIIVEYIKKIVSAQLKMFTPKGFGVPHQPYKSWVTDIIPNEETDEVSVTVTAKTWEWAAWVAANGRVLEEECKDIKEYFDSLMDGIPLDE